MLVEKLNVLLSIVGFKSLKIERFFKHGYECLRRYGRKSFLSQLRPWKLQKALPLFLTNCAQ